ncbi:hypothetical protein B0J18DRAFT_476305 [Chaetomium sp. MPI-SDFR-AT-0129]|nr:hypothetical protein B0J18DRAFT_476305 [Chaetomium sp. MPI-SDFR-AT-0129]
MSDWNEGMRNVKQVDGTDGKGNVNGVIGGLALWKYVQGGRTTQNVDFITSIDSAPHSVKNKVLPLPKSPLLQQAQFFFYKDRGRNYIQTNITPVWQSPYLPTSAKKLNTIPPGSVPYISPVDLLVAFSSRPEPWWRQKLGL